MRDLGIAPSRVAPWPAGPVAWPSSPRRVVDVLPDRRRREFDIVWRFTEEMAGLVAHPIAALDLVTRTAGEATGADAAAVLLHPARDAVLASRWGDVALPSGTKDPDLRRTLDAGWRATAAVPLRSGGREIGCLWVGRRTGSFDAEAQYVLRMLGSVTSLAVPVLLDAKPAPTARASTERAPTDAATPVPGDLRLASFPPARVRVLGALEEADDTDAAARIVATDPLLASAALRAADAAAAGRARAARTLREAVIHLGLRRIRLVAATSVLRSLARDDRPVDVMLWSTATGAALRARRLLRVIDARSDEHEAALAGLLSAVGALTLAASYPAAYEDVVRRSIRENRPLEAVEQTIFGLDHDALTRRLAHEWHLDTRLQPRGVDAAVMRHVVQWAWHTTLALDPIWQRFAAEEGAGVRDPWWATQSAAAARALGLDEADTSAVAHESAALLDEASALLGATSDAV